VEIGREVIKMTGQTMAVLIVGVQIGLGLL
jgi:hypothetical protein